MTGQVSFNDSLIKNIDDEPLADDGAVKKCDAWLDQHIQSLMSFDSAVTDLTPQEQVETSEPGYSPSSGAAKISLPSKESLPNTYSFLPPLISRAPKAEHSREICIPFLRLHFGICGACSGLIQALIHRHDSIRSSVRDSGCVGGLVRALEVATSCREEELLSTNSISSGSTKKRNATNDEILDKNLGVKVVNAIEVLIIRNVPAWDQIQVEAGVRGLLRLCLVGGPSIRVLSATALMRRIDEVGTGFQNTENKQNVIGFDIANDGFDLNSSAFSEFGSTHELEVHDSVNTTVLKSETSAITTGQSFDLFRATMVHELLGNTHKAKILDDRTKGISVETMEGFATHESNKDYKDIDDNIISAEKPVGEESAAEIEASSERRNLEIIAFASATKRRDLVNELVECGVLEAVSSMLESSESSVQTCALRFLRIVLINGSKDLREMIIDSRRPEDTYFGTDRNNSDFVFMGSTADLVRTYPEFQLNQELPGNLNISKKKSLNHAPVSDVSITSLSDDDYKNPFFISIPRIGKFLYSPEVDVVRAATGVLQVLVSANAIEVRKILKYYQHLEDLEVYSEKVPSYKLAVINDIKSKAMAYDKSIGLNPYHAMKSYSVLDDEEDASSRGRLPCMDSFKTSVKLPRRAEFKSPLTTEKYSGEALPPLDKVNVPLASRVGYRLFDMANGRILPVTRTSGAPYWTEQQNGDLSTNGLKGAKNAWMCSPDRYFPHQRDYLDDKQLTQDLDSVARNASLLAGILTGKLKFFYFRLFLCSFVMITDGEESNYTDGAPPLIETLSKAGGTTPYCEY